MENASKALLIAGAILIAILLIAMGMKVFTSTSGTTDSVEGTMNATEIAMFNNKFLAYTGYPKTKSDIKALLNIVIANNSINEDRKVTVDYSGLRVSAGSIEGLLNVIDTVNDYSQGFMIYVPAATGYTNGCISKIAITIGSGE